MARLGPLLTWKIKEGKMTLSTFKEAYDILQGHAQTLRQQQEPNVDALLSIVTESVNAYKVCKARIDAVEMALEQALSETALMSRESDKGMGLNISPSSTDSQDDGNSPL